MGERRRLVRRARDLGAGDRAGHHGHGHGARDGGTGIHVRARGQRARDGGDRAGGDRARHARRHAARARRRRRADRGDRGQPDRRLAAGARRPWRHRLRRGPRRRRPRDRHGPEITIGGLACGTAVTVGVRALDEAGNAGLRAAASLQTAACDGPADLYLAPKGRDRNRCTKAAPCRSFARAYALAEPGQTVELAAGQYGRQKIAADPTRTSLDDVTFRPAAGGRVTVGSLFIDASHITVRDMRVDGDWTTSATTEDVTFRNLDVRGGIYLSSSRNVSVVGGAVGPTVDVHPQFAAWPEGTHLENVLVDGVTFHDVSRTSEEFHVECLQIAGGVGVTVRNSRFTRCAIFDLSLTEYNGSGPPTDVVIENNVFESATQGGFYSLHLNSNATAMRNLLIRNNSSTQTFGLSEEPELDRVRVVANVAPLAQFACDERIEYDRNVWDGAACSDSDLNAPSGFVDAAGADMRLAPGSAAIDAGDPESYPARDRAGDPRPAGAAPDAGAYEVQ